MNERTYHRATSRSSISYVFHWCSEIIYFLITFSHDLISFFISKEREEKVCKLIYDNFGKY